jgi:hypothetical protein
MNWLAVAIQLSNSVEFWMTVYASSAVLHIPIGFLIIVTSSIMGRAKMRDESVISENRSVRYVSLFVKIYGMVFLFHIWSAVFLTVMFDLE